MGRLPTQHKIIVVGGSAGTYSYLILVRLKTCYNSGVVLVPLGKGIGFMPAQRSPERQNLARHGGDIVQVAFRPRKDTFGNYHHRTLG